MYQAYGWWFPDQDTHFAEMLAKNVSKGNSPVYQQPVRSRSFNFVKSKGVALDIGANVGLWSRDLCKHFQTVIAIEPVEDFRQCLIQNVPDVNLQTMAIALGNQETQIDMIITKHNTGHSHVDTSSIGMGKIPMHRLDNLDLPKLDYVKIDCEGYENLILQGAEKKLCKDKPVIVIEDKRHQDVGHTQTSGAVEMLQYWGAKILDQIKNDVILGWD